MRTLKIVGGFLLVLIAVIVIVVVFGLSKLNSIVELAIESTGTKTLQTAVDVDSVDLKLTEGRGEIQGLYVANPEGYSNNNIVSLNRVGLHLDIESLTGDVKVIKQVYVDGIHLRAEQKNITDTNIEVLINNLKNQVGSRNSAVSSSTKNTTENTTEVEQDIRLMIESLRVGESEIILETEQYGLKTIKLPAYTQTNIGDKAIGLSPDALSQKIMASLLSRAKDRVKEELRGAVKDRAKEKLQEKLEEKLGDKVEDIDKLKQLFK